MSSNFGACCPPPKALLREGLHVRFDITLFLGQLSGSLLRVLDIGGEPLLLISFQASCRVFQLVEGLLGISGCGVP